MLKEFIILCLFTFIVGYLLTWIIYYFKSKQFWGSIIQTKIHMWIPIFGTVLVLFQKNTWLTVVIVGLIALGIYKEYRARLPQGGLAYVLLVASGVLVLAVISLIDPIYMLAIWYMSVVADVTAYYCGTLLGYHKLPKQINSKKSWEGVAGQVIGALIGWLLLEGFTDINVSIWFALLVGFGTAIGDLVNSYVKRKNNFKDWSNYIPGHGGFLDRLSSLSFASILAGICLYFF